MVLTGHVLGRPRTAAATVHYSGASQSDALGADLLWATGLMVADDPEDSNPSCMGELPSEASREQEKPERSSNKSNTPRNPSATRESNAPLDTLGPPPGRKGASPIERMLARICREAGARVRFNANVHVRADDERRKEVLAQDLPCFGGAQLAIDVTLRSALRSSGEPQPHDSLCWHSRRAAGGVRKRCTWCGSWLWQKHGCSSLPDAAGCSRMGAPLDTNAEHSVRHILPRLWWIQCRKNRCVRQPGMCHRWQTFVSYPR